MNKLKKGFTLLELLIVIVILGLLVSLVSINVLPALNQAYLEKAKADISRLEQALVMFKINEGVYPNQTQGLKRPTLVTLGILFFIHLEVILINFLKTHGVMIISILFHQITEVIQLFP